MHGDPLLSTLTCGIQWNQSVSFYYIFEAEEIIVDYLYRIIRMPGIEAEGNHLPSGQELNISGGTNADMRRPQ